MSTRPLTLASVLDNLRAARRQLGNAHHAAPVYFTKGAIDLLLESFGLAKSTETPPARETSGCAGAGGRSRCVMCEAAAQSASHREPAADGPAEAPQQETGHADAEAERNAKRWDCLALLVGYNELARDAKTLGAKMYLRMGRDVAHDRYLEHGGTIDVTHTPPLVIVETSPPWVALSEHDIDLMRTAVAEYDAGLRTKAHEPPKGAM